MMRKVQIQDQGDTIFLENQLVHKSDFIEENDAIFGKKVKVLLELRYKLNHSSRQLPSRKLLKC